MLAVDQGARKGEEPGGSEEEEEARKMAERAHRPIGTARHLPVRHRDWTWEGVGEGI